MITDNFLDILKHTYNLGFLDLVKVNASASDIKVSAIEADRSVVLNGKLTNPISNFEGTVGLSRLSVLNGYLNFEPFKNKKSTVSIIKKNDGSNAPSEIKFDSSIGHTSHYRFMSEKVANEQIVIPPFKGVTWNVTITPSKQALTELSKAASILGAFESVFTVTTKDNNLNISIGESNTDRMEMVFASNIKGELKHSWSWPLTFVLSILKLSDMSESCVMKFSDQGALQIEINSGLGTYEYILPARTK